MSLAIALVILVTGMALLWLAIARSRPGLFFVSLTLLFGQALPLLTLATRPHAAPTSELLAYAGAVPWLCLLATLSFVLGYLPCARWQAVHPPRRAAPGSPLVERANILALLAAIIVVAIQPEGPAGFVLAGFERIPVDDFRFSLAYATACVLNFTALLVVIRRIELRQSPPALTLLCLFLLFFALGGRMQLLVTGASVALCYLFHGRLTRRQLLAPSLAFLALAVLTLQFRLSLQGDATIGFGGALAQTLDQVSLLDEYAIALRYIDAAGLHPTLYLESLQQLIPRALYPDKPVQIGRLLRLLVYRDHLGGLTVGVHGEFLIVGGHLAVAVLGLLFAAAVAALDNAMARLPQLAPALQAASLILLPTLTLFVIRGGFDNAIFRLELLLACLLVFCFCRALLPGPKRLPPTPRLVAEHPS